MLVNEQENMTVESWRYVGITYNGIHVSITAPDEFLAEQWLVHSIGKLYRENAIDRSSRVIIEGYLI